MEINIAGNQIEMPDSMKTDGYGIGDAGMLMYILRSRIYSDALGSMVREVISNARDANMEAGSNEPVRIVFPDHDYGTSELCVSDSGCGISEERMRHVFVMFCKSTKRQSTKEIGGFGLGCKTPFAYGDSFIVETVYDRVGLADFAEDGQHVQLGYAESDRARLEKLSQEGKCVTAATLTTRIKQVWYHFLDKTGGSGYTLLSTDSTDEPTGTTIKVPVKDPTATFVAAVKHVAKWWDVKPTTSLPIVWETIEVAFEGTTPSGRRWALTKRERLPDGTLAPAVREFVVSGVPYRVNTSVFDGDEESELLRNGVAVFFGQAEVPVTASREDVDYNPASIEFFASVLREVHTDALATVEEFKKTLTPSQMALFAYRSGVGLGGCEFGPISVPWGVRLYTISGSRRHLQSQYDPKLSDILILRDVKGKLFQRIEEVMANTGPYVAVATTDDGDTAPSEYAEVGVAHTFYSVEVDKDTALPPEMLIATIVLASSVKLTKRLGGTGNNYCGTARMCLASKFKSYGEMEVVPLARAAAMKDAVFIEKTKKSMSGLSDYQIRRIGEVMVVSAPTSRIEAFVKHPTYAAVAAKRAARAERRAAPVVKPVLEGHEYRGIGHIGNLKIAKAFPHAFNGTTSALLMYRVASRTVKANPLLALVNKEEEVNTDFLGETAAGRVKSRHVADYLLAKVSGRSITVEEFEKWVR
jgi:hypothetical protein